MVVNRVFASCASGAVDIPTCSRGFTNAIPQGCFCADTNQCLSDDKTTCLKVNSDGEEEEVEQSFWDNFTGGIFSSDDKPTYGVCKKKNQPVKRLLNHEGSPFPQECLSTESSYI